MSPQSAKIIRLSEVTRTTAISIQTSEGVVAISVADVAKWVSPEAPDPEALKFLMVCRARGLNPMLGEAHLVPFGTKWQTVIGKSGYLKLLEEHPAYAGHEAGIICRKWDSVAKQWIGDELYLGGSYCPADCRLLGGWAKIHRSDRPRPTFITIAFEEYAKNQSTWQTIPRTMIRKVALVHAAQESGLINAPRGYLPGEAPKPVWAEHPEMIEHAGERLELEYAGAREDANLPADLLSRIVSLRDQIGIPEDSFAWRDALAKRGVGHAAELTVPQATDLISRLSGLVPHPDLIEEDDSESFTIPEVTRAPRKGKADPTTESDREPTEETAS